MDTPEIREITPPAEQGLQPSAEPYIAALSAQYASRGLSKAVLDSAAEQIKREEETRALAPDAYRLSLYTDAAVNGHYRRGKDSMSSEDLLRYFRETRVDRIRNADFSGNTGMDECPGENAKDESRAVTVASKKSLPATLSTCVRSLPATVGERIKTAMPTWFNSAAPDSSKENKRYPFSAFAAILAVAASLMLIVASSVLLTRAESNISSLKRQISATSNEVAELKSDFEVRNDLLEIRRIAIEEYGMVEEDYVKMEYISLSTDDSVEVYEEEREKSVGLSAILSAIGIK